MMNLGFDYTEEVLRDAGDQTNCDHRQNGSGTELAVHEARFNGIDDAPRFSDDAKGWQESKFLI